MIKTWRFEYAPSGEPMSGSVRFFTGTQEELDKWFTENMLCKYCREEVEEGGCYYYAIGADGELEKGLTKHEVSGPWQTGCACEWDMEEINNKEVSE
jgi:hypothetical protein